MVSYSPSVPPRDAADLVRYLYDELSKISAAINEATYSLGISNVAPGKPRAGDLRIADGTNWNPGSGAGLYRHNGTTWVFIG